MTFQLYLLLSLYSTLSLCLLSIMGFGPAINLRLTHQFLKLFFQYSFSSKLSARDIIDIYVDHVALFMTNNPKPIFIESQKKIIAQLKSCPALPQVPFLPEALSPILGTLWIIFAASCPCLYLLHRSGLAPMNELFFLYAMVINGCLLFLFGSLRIYLEILEAKNRRLMQQLLNLLAHTSTDAGLILKGNSHSLTN